MKTNCCEKIKEYEYAFLDTGSNEGIVIGTCDSGNNALLDVKYCPFCGTKLEIVEQ